MKVIATKAGKIDAKVLGLGALLVLALLAVCFSWRMTNGPTQTPEPITDVQARATQDGDVDRLLASVEARVQEDAQVLNTDWPSASASAATRVKSESALKLRGVVRDGQQPMAFINDTTVGLGETVNGFTVEAIDAESVTLVDGRGRKQVLSLYENQ